MDFYAEKSVNDKCETPDPPNTPPWLVLVVDDEPDVLAITRAVLTGCTFEGRPIRLLEARSATKARAILKANAAIAVAILDVVMETDNAGLVLARDIRDTLGLPALRIILRTGQPGRAPERDVIVRYDINDYRLKSELTAHSLFTAVIAALRGHREIATRIQAEHQAVLAARSKAQFLANISHELRTPLNVIIGFSDIIAREGMGPLGSPKYQEFAEAIHDNGLQLLKTLNALIDMSRIDAGRYQLHEMEMSVSDLAVSCLNMTTDQADAAGITLTVDMADDLPALKADANAMRHILVNLLSNAIKFSPRGRDVLVKSWRETDGRPSFAVTDQGIGIPLDRMASVFQAFTQADGQLSRRFEGIGLGLSVVKGLTELHGGTIEIISAEGRGTTVIVRLPRWRGPRV